VRWFRDTRPTIISLHSGNGRPNFKCNRGIDIWGSNPDFWSSNHRSLPSSRADCSRYVHDIFQYWEFRGRMNLCFVVISVGSLCAKRILGLYLQHRMRLRDKIYDL